jgi:Ni,Fe-hydrogenase III large subunit
MPVKGSGIALKTVRRRTLDLKNQVNLIVLDLSRGQSIGRLEQRLEEILSSCLVLQDAFSDLKSQYGNMQVFDPTMLETSCDDCLISPCPDELAS